MKAVGRVGRAGAAGHETNAGPSRQGGARRRHHGRAGFLATYGDFEIGVMKSVQNGKVRFAGHAEDMLDALTDELVDQDAAARSECGRIIHSSDLQKSGRDNKTPVYA